MAVPPHRSANARPEPSTAPSSQQPGLGLADEEEKTTVDDGWQDPMTVADPPESPTAISEAGGRTVDELTVDDRRISDVHPVSSPQALPEAMFVVTQGPNRGQRFPLDKVVLTIGRSLDNDVVLIDTAMSRKHAKVEFDGIHFFIQDLGSGNGTIVNGRDEDDRYQLVHGDALELGRTILSFDCPAMAVTRPPIDPPKPRELPRPIPGKPAAPPPMAQPMPPMAQPMPPPAPVPADDPIPVTLEPDLLEEDDDDVSTIAADRAPGPGQLPFDGDNFTRPASPAGKNRHLQKPQDLVVPRKPVPGGVMPMPARLGPAPPSMPVPAMGAPSQAVTVPPIETVDTVAPMELDDEGETAAAKTRPAHPKEKPIARPGGRFQPSPQVVYPSAPRGFNRVGAASAFSPRPVGQQVGVMSPARRSGRSRWIVAGLVLVLVAAVVGVTLAAVTGRDGDEGAVASGVAADAGLATTDAASVATASADAASVAAASDAAADPVVRVALTTGAKLPASTWGTDEAVLDSLPDNDAPTVEPLQPDGGAAAEPADAGVPESGDEASSKPDKPAPPTKPDKGRDRDRDRLAARERQRADARFVRQSRDRANSYYRDRNFGRAARTARQAADRASGREKRKLRRLAEDYSEIGRLLTSARKTSSSRPDLALNAYLRAKRIDQRLGRQHTRFINNQVLLIGPKAAKMSIATGRLEAAARAVTASRAAGDRARTASVMRSLERKARELIAKGERAAKKGDKRAAAASLRQALKILPRQSELYGETKQSLRDL